MSLRIFRNKGFQVDLPNGYTVSVQFGPGNYCQHHHDLSDYDAPNKSKNWESGDAEVAVFLTAGPDMQFVMVPGIDDQSSDGMIGWRNAAQVVEILTLVAQSDRMALPEVEPFRYEDEDAES